MKENLLTLFLTASLSVLAQPRQETILTDDWRFSRDQQTWQTVRVPHDWAIAGPFDKKWDLQNVAIEQNGETEATEKSGRSGALPWIGQGHYKRTIIIPEGYKHAMLVFDGAMAEPTVSINGMQAGYWAYGYNTFRVDITPFIQTGDNLLEVDLQNVEESSRWYPGAGIYRPVKLVLTSMGWIDPWKTFIRTRELNANQAVLDVNVGIGSALDGGLKFEVEICDATGKMVASGSSDDLNNEGIAQMAITINQPKLWSPESPYLYTARIKYSQSGELLDQLTQKFGIRTVKVSKEGGFQLNGVTRKIKGVCLHHDLGPLGAAVNKSALIRQIKMMKEMGCDAIRTSHNMPSICGDIPSAKTVMPVSSMTGGVSTSSISSWPTATTRVSSCGASATRFQNRAAPKVRISQNSCSRPVIVSIPPVMSRRGSIMPRLLLRVV